MKAQKVYLGDGVYVEWEHGMLKLTTTANTIFLEPEVFAALQEYVKASVSQLSQ